MVTNRTTDKYLPAPRLQLRWDKAEQNERHYEWACHYELVLPLGEYDIRREIYDSDGVQIGELSELVIAIKPPTLRGGGGCPCQTKNGERYSDPPFRDGAHAIWDSKVLNEIPIYVIAPDGEAFEHKSSQTNQ